MKKGWFNKNMFYYFGPINHKFTDFDVSITFVNYLEGGRYTVFIQNILFVDYFGYL